MPKKRILIFINWFLPAFKAGGPVQSVANIIEVLHGEFDFHIITSDRDLGDSKPFDDVLPDTWITQENYNIIYLSPQSQKILNIRALISGVEPDFIYLNSLFSVRFTLLPILASRNVAAKTILAPRGMLGAGALKFKAFKKSLYIFATKNIGTFRNVTWHATDESEMLDIQKHYGSYASVKMASNLSSKNIAEYEIKTKTLGSTRFLSFSKISHKKNIGYAIDRFSTITTHVIQLDMAGPIEHGNYWLSCQKKIQNLPPNINVDYKGSIPRGRIGEIFENVHFLILPTFHENFGHVIIEALKMGCPVIISDQTPWRDLQEKGIGWDLPLGEPHRWVEVINECCEMTQEKYDEMSRKAYTFAENFISNPGLIEATRKLFID